jgi:hypothetical protein
MTRVRTMDERWAGDMYRDSRLHHAIVALSDLVPETSGHARLTLEDALATLQEERAMIVRRWN